MYEINSETWENDEGSSFARVIITIDGGEPIVEEFASYFDSPSESAIEQASAYVAAFEDCQLYSIEDRLGPFGIEWEREQLDREVF